MPEGSRNAIFSAEILIIFIVHIVSIVHIIHIKTSAIAMLWYRRRISDGGAITTSWRYDGYFIMPRLQFYRSAMAL